MKTSDQDYTANNTRRQFKNENRAVMGLFESRTSLEAAVAELKRQSFRNADISALLPSNESTKEFAHINATKSPEGTATGGTAGALMGGTLGWLAGIGSLAIPGLGALIAAGPIVGTLAGIGAGSAIGGLAGALIGLGIPEFEAKRFEGSVKNGGFLLSVHCDSHAWEEKAEAILREAGAKEVASGSESGSNSDEAIENDIPRIVGNYDS